MAFQSQSPYYKGKRSFNNLQSILLFQKQYYIISEHIRSALLDSLPGDIAYKLKINIVHFEEEDDEVRVIADVICEQERWGKMVAIALEKHVPGLEGKFRQLFGQNFLLEVVAKFEGKAVVVV